MTEVFHGSVEIRDSGSTIRLDANEGEIAVRQKIGGPVYAVMKFEADSATLSVGTRGKPGGFVVQDGSQREAFRLDASPPRLHVGSDEVPGEVVIGNYGTLVVRDHEGRDILTLGGTRTALILGGNRRYGQAALLNDDGRQRIRLEAGKAAIWVGGNEESGDIVLFNERVRDTKDPEQATIHLEGETGTIHLGTSSGRGRIQLRPFGGALCLRGDDGYEGIELDAHGDVKLGGNGRDGRIQLYNRDVTQLNQETATIYIDAYSGDIVFRNADCAEEFDVSDAEDADPGTVMVVEREDKLRPSTEAYDKRVAGVISGAAGCQPGVILGRRESEHKRMPLALSGKVFCKADAGYSPIEVGDLLTTSGTAGHAMKATDPIRSFGAVIGKALRALPDGTGLIPILVALQ